MMAMSSMEFEGVPHECYIRLYYLEKTLRWFIWKHWDEIVKHVPEIARKAEKYMQQQLELERRMKVPTTKCIHPVWYLDFPKDYIEIIKRNRRIFNPLLGEISGDRDVQLIRLIDELEKLWPLRRNIAHMRPLSPQQVELLNSSSRRLLRFIWDYINGEFVDPANECIEKGDFKKAEELLLKGLEETAFEDRGDPWIAFNLGMLYKKLGRHEEARRWIEYAKKRLPLPEYVRKAEEALKDC